MMFEILMELLTKLNPAGALCLWYAERRADAGLGGGGVTSWCQLARWCRAADCQIDLQFGLIVHVRVSECVEITLGASPPRGIVECMSPVERLMHFSCCFC